MPHSHHSHSGQYCSHAHSALDDILARAASLGFRSYALTEHVPRALPTELYPEEIHAGIDNHQLISRFKHYLAHARKLQHHYHTTHNSIQVLVACETESTDGVQGNHLDFFVDLINSLSPSPSSSPTTSPARIGTGVLDYILGSVHHIHSIPIDFDQHTFTNALQHYSHKHDSAERQHRALIEDYLDAQYHLLQRLRPEVIGHFDLCRLYAPDTPMRPSHSHSESGSGSGSNELEPIWSKVQRNVRFAASYGALFEINSASFRKGWKTAYPGRDILDLILSLGGRICLSDDSHSTHQVGQNYTQTRTYLLSLTPSPPLLWYLRRRRPIPTHEHVDDEEEEEELARGVREQSERPGANAPTLFARGTQAVPCWEQDWAAWPGWQKMQEAQASSES